ncbi:MAG: lycopene cyclase domain-containing protein [Chryseobacterium sp.]|nr:lycopene cyclase domain-containing protein [Chryseobacterium sp.]
MQYYYIILDIFSFLIPFSFSFEKKMLHFIQYWKAFFTAIISVGLFFIAWDVYFTYQNVWGFSDQYLLGIRIFKLPLEEWLFFLLIPYSSLFIHYSLLYFFPKPHLSKGLTQILSVIFFLAALSVTVSHIDKIYTSCSFGFFALIMLLQIIFQFKYARRFYLSFIIIYIPFFFVNNALTGAYSESPVVFYNSTEILGYRVGTMPLEDSFYCFSLLYGILLVFEYLKKKWNSN